MPDTKFSAATLASDLDGTELLGITQGGADRAASVRQIAKYSGDALGNQSTADQALTANATTYMTGSAVGPPTGERIRVGTIFRWHGTVTKTAAGTAAKSLVVKGGTAGAVGDTTLLTFALPAGTAAVDTGYFEINVTVTVIGGSAVIRGTLIFTHNLATTGLININQQVVYGVSATFNSAVDLLKFGVALVAGASEAWTVKQIFGEAKNL